MMKQLTSLLISVFLLAAFSMAITTKVTHAYIDATTGSLLIQFLLAGFFGSLIMVKVFWRRLVDQLNRMLAKIKGSSTS